ncbi:alpha/beta hydrolase [Pseudoalteromonas sp. T1lg65]|uniref:alpha/beta hydrolase n=1 Tax=Pseudoalteromonas sp. T1lg65 TaxID=2077101 RepID=UPI003F7B0E4E
MKKMFKKSVLVSALFALSGVQSLHANQSTGVSLTPCYAKGLDDRAQCGVVSQPLNSQQPDQKIDIHFMVIPAIKPLYKEEAVIAFAGGPGQSAVEIAANFERFLAGARENRDIILVDQRGTGKSNLLQCELDDLASQFALDDSVGATQLGVEDAKECQQKLDQDLSNYTTVAAAKDFDAVREALGYKKLHLYGGSYGTRIALEYMRQFPQSVATAVLDGAAPSNQNLVAIGGAIEDSLNALFERCEQEEQCSTVYPNLKTQWQQVLANIAANPVKVNVRHPRTNQNIDLVMTEQKLYSTVRFALYSHVSRALVPLAISQAAQNNFDTFVGLMSGNESGLGIAMGMHSAIVCGEDWPSLTQAQRAEYGKTYVGNMMLEGLDAACPVWNVKPVDKSYYQPVESDIPTLLLSGGLDPATPAAWAEVAKQKLSNSTHLVAPYATHIVASQTCANKLVAHFYDEQTVEGFDTSCLEEDRRKQFFLNINGPALSQSEE